jgi:predicted ester cyclase
MLVPGGSFTAPSSTEDMLCAWLAAGDRGDVDEFDRYLHPEVVVHAPLGLSTTGVEAEKAVWADGKRAIPDIRHEVLETMASGSRAMARVVVTGTLRGEFASISAAGKSFEIDQVVFAHFRDGLIVEVWEIADTGSLLGQLGVAD